VAEGRAGRLKDVRPQLALFDSTCEAVDGWGVFVLAYEAAPAFDPAMRTHARPPEGTPYLWWAVFGERRPVPPLAAIASRVTGRQRAANRLAYPNAVDDIRARIERGEVYQVNHTDRFHGTYTGTPFDMYAALVGVQSCAFGAFVDMGSAVIASASPELFFTIDGATITCRPMKGTAPRHPRAELDDAVGTALVDSVKDRAENVMIVDLLRNDLSRVASLASVAAPRLFALERYETVWQLTSTVTAELAPGVDLDAVLGALFPCGSVTGAPKIAAMGVIAELEAEPRGVYCGTIGVTGPPSEGRAVTSSVPIRTAVLDPAAATFVYGAGAGITWSSDREHEDDEVRAKARILNRSRRTFDLLETLRLDGAGVHHAEAHLDRMAASARWFGFAFDRTRAAGLLGDLAPSVVVQRVRLTLSPGGALNVAVTPLDPGVVPVRLALDTVATPADDPFCTHKTTYRRHYEQARARHLDADDVVLVNERGEAIETTIANLAFRIGEAWFVPPLTCGGLAGVGRAQALADGRAGERVVLAADLGRCDELAVINDLRGWRPAVLAARD
jgi:para-aminobenzoate synthetase/4-amino-4-deoxychorismate lyase